MPKRVKMLFANKGCHGSNKKQLLLLRNDNKLIDDFNQGAFFHDCFFFLILVTCFGHKIVDVKFPYFMHVLTAANMHQSGKPKISNDQFEMHCFCL